MKDDKQWVIEVQHASDTDLDGSWTEIDRVRTEKAARSRAGTIAFGYLGRPIRITEIAA